MGAVVVQIFGGLQIFGTRLYSNYTPADLIYNPFGPDFTHEKATEILKCMKSSPSSIPVASGDPVLPAKECPSYFQFMHKDLEPWKETGITLEMIELAKPSAFFRIVILDSKLYVERYRSCFFNRAVFDVWGLLLFLEKFRGQVPDLEFVFNCGDVPRFPKTGSAAVMFAYDSNHGHYDIPFPDWTFWGWCVYIAQPTLFFSFRHLHISISVITAVGVQGCNSIRAPKVVYKDKPVCRGQHAFADSIMPSINLSLDQLLCFEATTFL